VSFCVSLPPTPTPQGWKLHVWGDVTRATDWGRGLEPTGFEDGPYWNLKLKTSANHVGVLIYKGDSLQGEQKAAGWWAACVPWSCCGHCIASSGLPSCPIMLEEGVAGA